MNDHIELELYADSIDVTRFEANLRKRQLQQDYIKKIQAANAYLNILRKDRPKRFIVLSFRDLQEKRILDLQERLLRRSIRRQELTDDEESMVMRVENELEELHESIDRDLHTYANAIRDHEILCLESSDIISPLTGLKGHFARLTQVTKNLFRQKKPIDDVERDARETLRALESQGIYEGFEFRELNQEVRLHNERRKGFFDRLGMGIFGGIALIGPMLLMVLHRDLNTSITTASVATILFALLLAIGGEGLAGKDVLAATAAYAAVLVVFVGTSTNTTL